MEGSQRLNGCRSIMIGVSSLSRLKIQSSPHWKLGVVTGDESNIHAPQSYEAEAELRYISKPSLNVISPQDGKPIVVIVQDSLIASFLMTRDNKSIPRHYFFDICMKGELVDGSEIFNPKRVKEIESVLKRFNKKPDVFNGRGLISLLLPNNLFYEKRNGKHPDEPIVKIHQGVFLEGALDKNILGQVHGSLIQILNKEFGSEIVANFIDNVQFISNAWMSLHGFSIGLEDCIISENKENIIRSTLAEYYMKAQGIEETTQNPGIREVRVTAVLSQARDIGMKIAKDAMEKNNNFLVTVTSEAKGDYFNIAQITSLLGQQNIEGKRVASQLNGGKRSLVHYPFGQMDKEREYESRGFIKNSLIRGLCPEEFIFHAMSGREGVINTAMSTAKSGYTQRKIVKICEDLQVNTDGTVRDNTGKIYQYNYGSNGYESSKTIKIDDKPNFCDISRLVNKLNNEKELGIVNELERKDLRPIVECVYEDDFVKDDFVKDDFVKEDVVEKVEKKEKRSVKKVKEKELKETDSDEEELNEIENELDCDEDEKLEEETEETEEDLEEETEEDLDREESDEIEEDDMGDNEDEEDDGDDEKSESEEENTFADEEEDTQVVDDFGDDFDDDFGDDI